MAILSMVALLISAGLFIQSCRIHRRAMRIYQQASPIYRRARAAHHAARQTEQQATTVLQEIGETYHRMKEELDAAEERCGSTFHVDR